MSLNESRDEWLQVRSPPMPHSSSALISRFSQGGQLVHNAAKLLSSSAQANVNSGMNRFLPLSTLEY